MDRLISMEVFVQVVDQGSFAGAARQMSMSRAMVSKHIQALEERLGARLLNRTTRTVSLTEVGTAYYERCQTVLNDVEEAECVVDELHHAPKGTLKINAPMTFGARHLAEALTSFKDEYPDVTIDLSLNDRLVDLVEEGYDVAIRIGELADSSLIARKLNVCRRVLCASPDYLQKHGTPESLRDLGRHNCLLYTLSPKLNEWRFIDAEGTAHSVRVDGSLQANNGDVLRLAAIGGHGIVLQPTFIVGPDIKNGKLVPILTDYMPTEINIHLVYPHNRYLTAKVRSFIDFMVAHFKGAPPWDDWLKDYPDHAVAKQS
ncbi:MAG: LysR family transcriptional regulator [Micavibrio sp. TMED2]|nr:LysR family transcriptional regulator [Alphaproteobacteria bacterium]MAS48639.1 LysR family transcriptional regulator [Alphaproteobacteria bacterium]MAX96102.1 LysR family transcriptional regulator [Alphaproteobacteria bacterium]OUT39285.1 MAG: LysR family transcriptional regulator [Micavibrio sp. TMED2]|tara:strand:- start:8358 stop:9305 length:948 start_codon:yes stop_codon:yes gene_type:complete